MGEREKKKERRKRTKVYKSTGFSELTAQQMRHECENPKYPLMKLTQAITNVEIFFAQKIDDPG